MSTRAPVFNETYEDYLSQIAGIDLAQRQDMLGFEILEGQAIIPLFDKSYQVNADGVKDLNGKKPQLSICVVLFKYLLMCPEKVPQGRGLAGFKDFKDAAPLIHFFSNTVEGDVVRSFSGNAAALDKACAENGGELFGEDLAYQIKYRFKGLPRIPVYLLFNDAEEGFAAQCSILFESRTEAFLDMESVAMLGSALSQMLVTGKS